MESLKNFKKNYSNLFQFIASIITFLFFMLFMKWIGIFENPMSFLKTMLIVIILAANSILLNFFLRRKNWFLTGKSVKDES